MLKDLHEKHLEVSSAMVLKELYKEIPMEVIQKIIGLDVDESSYQYWIDEVLKQSKVKGIKRTLHGVADMIRDNKDPDAITAYIEEQITARLPSSDSRIYTPDKLKEKSIARMKERVKNPDKMIGVQTGFNRLDRVTLGVSPGDLMIVAAQTGVGKSALALNMAKNMSIKDKHTVFYLNTEMSEGQVSDRLCSILTGLDYYNVRLGNLDLDGQDKALDAYDKIGESKLFITDAFTDVDLAKTTSIMRKFKAQHDLEVFILDYVGRLDIGWDKRYPNEYQVLEQAAKRLKGLAQQLKIGVIMLAQLNEDDQLAGSKRMENESDIFLKLLPIVENDRELYNYPPDQQPDHWLYVKKNRDGVCGIRIGLNFIKEKMIVEEVVCQPR